MPRDNDKNNDSRGRRDRPGRQGRAAARAVPGAARGPEKNSPSAALPARAKATASGVPMPGSPTARNRSARSPIPAIESPMPASATATTVRRAGILAMRRVPRGDRPLCRPSVRAVTMVKSVRSSRAKIVAVARSARSSRAAIVRTSTATTVRRAATATMRVRQARFVRQEIRRQEALYPARRRRREAALYAAWRRFSQGRRPSARRSAVQRPAVARWRSSPWRSAERKFGGDKKFSRGAPDRGPRKDFGDRPDRGRIAATQSRGRSARIAASGDCPSAPATARAISTSRALIARATTAAARSVRASRRARIVATAIARNSTVPRERPARAAPTGRSIRAAKRGRRSSAPRERGRQQDLRKTPGVRRPRRLSRAQA